jgi:hypothetical protein
LGAPQYLLQGLHEKIGKLFGTWSTRGKGIGIFIEAVHSALSETLDNTLPYDDVLALRDRMWELSPSLVRYGTLERTSTDIALAGLKTLATHTASAKVTGGPFVKPISNFYQTDPISRACVLTTFFACF